MAGNAENENVEESIISMVDYLKEEQELVDDANAVLGDSDENYCTYAKGYVGRQALYSCSTCETKDNILAGFCLACSYSCHEGHDLYELYTKRNFRCDCGTSKYTDLKCKLFSDKPDNNVKNLYNQNFKGLYCVCKRPYPDPEDEIEDEMIQCIICEDWYHGRHLGGCKPPSSFQEMICQLCMKKHEFLWAYTVQNEGTTSNISNSSSENSVVSVDVENTGKTDDKQDKTDDKQDKTDDKQDKSDDKQDKTDDKQEPDETTDKQKVDNCDKKDESKETSVTSQCLLVELQKRKYEIKESATFWPEGFRSKLCTCSVCKTMYKDAHLEYLPDQSDTVSAYENRGKSKAGTSTEADQEQQVLNSMNRVQQIEMVQGFNDMKSALSDYLKRFAENGKVVRAEDIREFFSQMEQRKKQKTDHTPGHFCR
ncbi:putative E3 ubiquitin-protein ligase ubr7 [Mactra antiquata]